MWVPVAAVLVAGLLATAVGAWGVSRSEARTRSAAADRYAVLAQNAVQAELRRYVDTVDAAAAALTAQSQLTAADFAIVTQPLEEARLAGASGVALVVPATSAEAQSVQLAWRFAGSTDLTLGPSPAGQDTHLYTVLGRALDGGQLTLGRDLGSTFESATAIRATVGTEVRISQPYVLARDQNKPQAERQLSFILTARVGSPGSSTPRGWLIMGLRSGDFLTRTLRQATQDRANAMLSTGENGSSRVVSQTVAGAAGDDDLLRTVTVRAANQPWTLRVQSTDAAATQDAGGGHLTYAVAGGGIAVSILLACVLWLALTSRRRALLAVDRATAELREAEEEARRQSSLMSAVLDTISEGVAVVTRSGEFVLANPSVRRLLGNSDDLSTLSASIDTFDVFKPDGTTPVPIPEQPMPRALAGEVVEQEEIVVKHAARPAGIPLSISARPLDPRGGVEGAVAVFRDISSRHRAEAELRDSEARRRTILDTAPDAFIGMDQDQLITDWNPAATRLLGWSHEDAIGRRLDDLIVPDELREAHVAAVDRFLHDGETSLPPHAVELEALHRDGHRVPVELGVSRMRWRSGWRFHGFLRDVSERQAAAAEQRATEERFRFAFEHAHVGMVMTELTEDGIDGDAVPSGLVRVNDAMCTMLGYTRDELTARTLADVTHPDDRGRARPVPRQRAGDEDLPVPDPDGDENPLAELIGDGVPREKRYLHADGHIIWAHVVSKILRDREGRPNLAVALIEDVTTRRAENERLSAMALQDPLTGLGNRMLLEDRLKVAAARSARSGRLIAVLYCDLDGFKPVNDVHGHAAGDEVLQEVAHRLRETVRASDTVARIGGDEFVVLCEDLDHEEDVEPVTSRVKGVFERPITLTGGTEVVIGCSTGSAIAGGPDIDVDHLLHFADTAMYVAKRAKRRDAGSRV